MMKYTPIDYTKWNDNGQGENILPALSPPERNIWEKALPYQDKRLDSGHAEFVTYFALQLLQHSAADREIVVPAAILHDLGWSQMSPAELELFADPNMERYEPILRARHQEEGVLFAGTFLGKVDYSRNSIVHILEIISQHDTRNGFYSPEDGVMRDADKLWRFTVPEMKVSVEYRRKKLADLDVRNRDYIQDESFLFSESARKMAQIEWENTLRFIGDKYGW